MENRTQNRLSIKKNDLVEVISGNEFEKTGRVIKVDTKSLRVTIERVRMLKNYIKPSQTNPGGGIEEKEGSIHYSNILLMCPKCNCGVRHGIKFVEASSVEKKSTKKSKKAQDVPDSKDQSDRKIKIRFCKKCGESLEGQV